ncbi:MAG: hypothetical protein Q4Q42_00325 [Planctomycetia bacterium]|nr:hypothetical protein [Planctomycetia bacterium]
MTAWGTQANHHEKDQGTIVVLRDVGLGYVFAAPLPMICKTKGYASVKAHILVVVLALRNPWAGIAITLLS